MWSIFELKIFKKIPEFYCLSFKVCKTTMVYLYAVELQYIIVFDMKINFYLISKCDWDSKIFSFCHVTLFNYLQ